MKPIPITNAKEIAQKYDYDQIIIYGRKVGDSDDCGEHVTTYGIDTDHCNAAAKIGNYLKFNVFGWKKEDEVKYSS